VSSRSDDPNTDVVDRQPVESDFDSEWIIILGFGCNGLNCRGRVLLVDSNTAVPEGSSFRLVEFMVHGF
jgi:hypothetical protein